MIRKRILKISTAKKLSNTLKNQIPQYIKDTAFVRLFGLTKVPMLWYLKPTVVELGNHNCEIKIPLNRQSKNHLNSMYFGALCTGADCAAGLMAMREIQKSKRKVSLVFKDFHAEFIKRAEGTTHFKNMQGIEISELVKNVIKTKERKEMTMQVYATVPSKLGEEVIAKFELTLSLKLK